MTFKELVVGDEFDFIGPDRMLNSFYPRCIKTGPRSYEEKNTLNQHRIGSTNAKVYNIKR